MRVLVTGSSGMLGHALCAQTAPPDIELQRADIVGAPLHLDITDASSVRTVVRSAHPDVIIHCAAFTNVDAAESQSDLAFRVNALGPELVAREAEAVSAAVCYISTDFVFDGAKGAPYHEYDETHPLGVYAASKLAGEHAVARQCTRHWIVRTAWLYGEKGRNFPATILGAARQGKPLRVVADQMGSPTYTRDLAQTLWDIVRRCGYGTYHAVNSGVASWYDLACRTLHYAGMHDVPVEPIPSREWPSPARRPSFTPLISLRGSSEGLEPMRSWETALQDFIVRFDQPTPSSP